MSPEPIARARMYHIYGLVAVFEAITDGSPVARACAESTRLRSEEAREAAFTAASAAGAAFYRAAQAHCPSGDLCAHCVQLWTANSILAALVAGMYGSGDLLREAAIEVSRGLVELRLQGVPVNDLFARESMPADAADAPPGAPS